MSTHRWRMMRGTAESAPSLAVVLLTRSGGDPISAGWVGCVLAVTVLAWFTWRRVESDTILLGVNIYIAAITPLITALFYMGLDPAAETVIANVQFLLIATITATGAVLHLRGQFGFIGDEDAEGDRNGSAMLLAAAVAAAVWSYWAQGEMIPGVVIPIMALFGLRGFLIARARDRVG